MTKVGRNDPCPCGSGKKYKQCCWSKRLPLGKRKFKASVIKSGPSQIPDLMERTFGEMINSESESVIKDSLAKLAPKMEDMPDVDAQESLEEYLKESEEAKKKKSEDDSA